MKLNPPDVQIQHVLAALKAHGLKHVAATAEAFADLDEAKGLEELATRLPVTGHEVLAEAKALRNRARIATKRTK